MRTYLMLALAVGLLGVFASRGNTDAVVSGHVPSCGDYNLDGARDVVDITTFMAPVRRLDTSPGHPNFDAAWDRLPGPGILSKYINIQDLLDLLPLDRACPDATQFLSKLTDFDDQYRADPIAGAAMMNDSYEAVMTFSMGCGICQTLGNAYDAGPAYVYLDPTALECANSACSSGCTGDQPGVDCGDVLRTTGGAVCWQRYFEGSRALADVTQPDVRADAIAYMQAHVALPYGDAIYIDVAEAWLPNATTCGSPTVSNAAWLTAWATFVEEIQAAVDGPLIINSQYFTWQSLIAASPANADRFWAAPDVVEIEFGWAYGRHGEGTVSGAAAKLAYIDRLHGLGTGVFTQDYPEPGGNYDFPASLETFGLAMYLVTAGPGDYYGTFNHDGHGSAYNATLYERVMGDALGPRYTCGSGCYARDYERGTVTATVTTKTGVIP